MSRTRKIYMAALLLLLIGSGAALSSAPAREALLRLFSRPIPTYTYKVIHSWPHDSASFTEGLVIKDGVLYESAGRNGSSSLRVVDQESGEVRTRVDLGREYFAEGITVLDGKVFQLTWQSHKGFIYDRSDLALIGEFEYAGEGWGLTDDGSSLIMSNGTNAIRFLDPQTFQVQRVIEVYDDDKPLVDLNELEYVNGEIFANIWHSDKIVRIDPGNGGILGWIDLTGLYPLEERSGKEAVLNGIAYDQAGGRLLVTGKLWPRLFEIQLEKE